MKKYKEYALVSQRVFLKLRCFPSEFDYLYRVVRFGGKTRHRRRDLRTAYRCNRKINKLRQVKDPPFDGKNSKQYRKYVRRLERFLKEE